MERQAIGVTDGRESGLLSPCVCSTLRMVSRAVTQLYDDILRPSGLRVTQFSILATIARSGEANLRQLEAGLAIDQTTLTRSLSLLQRDRVIERVPHPDGRIKAVRLTRKGRRMLDVARPALGPGTEQGAPAVEKPRGSPPDSFVRAPEVGVRAGSDMLRTLTVC